jgi:eukaryotic-like serine/threonine-protein kinase
MPTPDRFDRLKEALAGRYAVLGELGGGGMAMVYVAEDLKHHRKVAVKVLRPELAAALGHDRFTREIEIAAQLQHPHILPLLDSGEADGILYYVMPYVDGDSLRDRLVRHGELPIPEAVKLLCEIVDALAYAHAHGVVHRDIKPDNVMLSGRHALVMDFGVAKAVSEATGRQSLTTAGVALGTPAYMAPEQASADPHLDHRVDIYAVGAMAYEFLAGRPPFTGATPQQVLAAHVTQAPEPITAHRAGISPALAAVVMKCLAKRPADRWQTADELLAQLEPILTPSAGTTPAETRPVAAVRRPTVSTRAVIVLAVVALVGAAAAILLSNHRSAEVTLGRRTQVTIDPGLEVDPAISPDGKFITYAAGPTSLMKLFVRRLEGGNTIPISSDLPGNLRRPLWSPDGARIAFQTPRGIETVAALGGIPKLLVGAEAANRPADFAWSPDGQRIAYRHRDTLYTRALDGGTSRPVAAGFEMHSPAWSPNGAWIAYVSGNPDFVFSTSIFGNLAPSAIWLVPAAGGQPIPITNNKSLNVSPVWLPRGRQLLFISDRDGGRDIYRVALRSSGQPVGPPTRLSAGLNAHTISLSADGKRLTYSVFTETANVWSVPVPRGDAVSVSQGSAVTTGRQIIEGLDVSRDGRWLAFDSDRSGNQDIYKMPLAGGEPEQLTTDPQDDFGPAWSPDGKEIAFHSFRNGNRDIFIIPAAGGPAQPVVATPAQERGPDWSADGQQFAFSSNQTGRYEVHVVSRKGRRWGTPRRVTSGADLPRTGGAFRWSPDGRFIAYIGGRSLKIISPAGREPRTLVDVRDSVALPVPEKLAWSPDSRLVYFVAHDAQGLAGVWSVALTGGPPRRRVGFDDPATDFARGRFAMSGNRVYFALEKRESDIWTAEVLTR